MNWSDSFLSSLGKIVGILSAPARAHILVTEEGQSI